MRLYVATILKKARGVIASLRLAVLRRSVTSPSHLRTGEWGESVATDHLKGKRFRIRGRRVRIGRRDEIDIIAQCPKGVLVFVEVKTRADETFGRPISSVDRRKRRVLSRAAWRYLRRMRPRPEYFRFDVVEVVGSPAGGPPLVRHIENAFQLQGNRRIPW